LAIFGHCSLVSLAIVGMKGKPTPTIRQPAQGAVSLQAEGDLRCRARSRLLAHLPYLLVVDTFGATTSS
jgi:hypothetical protein